MTIARQFVNRPEDLVAEALEGLVIAHPAVDVDLDRRIVTRRTPATGKVAVVSGGGSGHEPLHAGCVGRGMLDAAVAGAVFASPTATQIHDATRRVDSGEGVLHIVKNYTGDVINFALAADFAADDRIEVETVLVDDDLATDQDHGPGRRGTAAVIPVEKMCGAAAERGMPLAELAVLGRRIVSRSRSLGMALAAGTRPGTAAPQFELAAHDVEFGVGIHGERGRDVVGFRPLDDLIDRLAEPLLRAVADDRLLVIVNGLGATTQLELYAAARRASTVLAAHGRLAERWLVGSYVTSLDMRGISLTLTAVDDQLLALWDAPVHTPAFSWGGA
ncbi:MAG: dihydroxyacetone kinase subunit DhaK [Microbacterium sp.]